VLFSTETLVRTLTTYVVNRGILTTIMQIGQFITYVSLPDTVLVWAVFHFPGSKIYVNSLIAVYVLICHVCASLKFL